MPCHSGVRIGALVCKSQYDKVMGYIKASNRVQEMSLVSVSMHGILWVSD